MPGVEEHRYTILMRRGPVPGLRVLLPRQGRIVIGRDTTCDLPLDDSRTSRRQCEIEVDTAKEVLTLHDLGSSNGTYLNRTKTDKAELKPGDRIYFGRCVFEVQRIRVTEQIRIEPSDGRPVDPGADTQVLKGLQAISPDVSNTPTEEGEIPDFASAESEAQSRGTGAGKKKKTGTRKRNVEDTSTSPTPEQLAGRSPDEFNSDTLDIDLEGSGRFHIANLVKLYGEPMKTETLEPIDVKEWQRRPSGRLVRVRKSDKLAPKDPTETSIGVPPSLGDASSTAFLGTDVSSEGGRSQPPNPGDFVGPYRLIEPLGEGFTGPVFRCVHSVIHTNHAIKLLTPEFAENETTAFRFQWEAEISGMLDHPNVRRLTNAGEHGALRYIVFDFVEGADLGRIVHSGAPLPQDSALYLGIKGCDALEHVHERGIIHRAVTPTSVLVPEDGNIRLCDFNLAQRLEKPAPVELLDESINAFDLCFRAPELLEANPTSSEAADVYGLCATLYFAVTGVTPIDASDPERLPEKIRTVEPRTASDVNPGLSDGFCHVLRCGMAKSPTNRFATVKQLRAALAELLDESHST